MKAIQSYKGWLRAGLMASSLFFAVVAFGQEEEKTEAEVTETPEKAKPKPVKNTFESIWIIDNQTVMVPVKKTFEMDIMHRFGTIKNGYEDFFGFFAPSNIRLGFNYVPINNLMVGVSITKANMTWEAYGKYALMKQEKNGKPVSVSYFADMSIDSRPKDNFINFSDRLMYFHQLLIARKVNEKLSLQIAPSVSHINVVNGYYKQVDSAKSEVRGEMKHQHFAIAGSARYKVTPAMSILVNVDQPITKHVVNNPKPNLSFGIEVGTGSHAFQFFLGNYANITPQRNNYFNKNDYTKGEYLIGFNIIRLWNY